MRLIGAVGSARENTIHRAGRSASEPVSCSPALGRAVRLLMASRLTPDGSPVACPRRGGALDAGVAVA